MLGGAWKILMAISENSLAVRRTVHHYVVCIIKIEKAGSIMEFNINGTKWTIKLVNEATINNEIKQDGTLGITIYKTQEIMLLEDQANIIKTLKHELTHVWLYEYGHSQSDDSRFGQEDICEIVASINDFINEIVSRYKRELQETQQTVIPQKGMITKIKINGESYQEWLAKAMKNG